MRRQQTFLLILQTRPPKRSFRGLSPLLCDRISRRPRWRRRGSAFPPLHRFRLGRSGTTADHQRPGGGSHDHEPARDRGGQCAGRPSDERRHRMARRGERRRVENDERDERKPDVDAHGRHLRLSLGRRPAARPDRRHAQHPRRRNRAFQQLCVERWAANRPAAHDERRDQLDGADSGPAARQEHRGTGATRRDDDRGGQHRGQLHLREYRNLPKHRYRSVVLDDLRDRGDRPAPGTRVRSGQRSDEQRHPLHGDSRRRGMQRQPEWHLQVGGYGRDVDESQRRHDGRAPGRRHRRQQCEDGRRPVGVRSTRAS